MRIKTFAVLSAFLTCATLFATPTFANAICPAGSYEQKPDGRCQANGVCKVKPDFCTKEYKPVCGCDKKTYGNRCEAEAAGMSVYREGKCP